MDQKEIDKMFETYAKSDSVSFYTSHGAIKGKVTRIYNLDNNPQAIKINGDGSKENIYVDALAEMIFNLIQQKKKQGYTYVNSSGTLLDPGYEKGDNVNSIKNCFPTERKSNVKIKDAELKITYKREIMYFNVTINSYMDNGHNTFYFEVETGDDSRSENSRYQNFVF